MSGDYKSKIILGLPYEEMEVLIGKDLLDDEVTYGNLDIGSGQYDSERKHNVVGVALVSTSWYKVFTLDQLNELEVPASIAGLPLKLYLTNDIT